MAANMNQNVKPVVGEKSSPVPPAAQQQKTQKMRQAMEKKGGKECCGKGCK